MATRLENLLKKQEQLQNRIKQEQAKAKKRERKVDTRRKILLGALLMEMMEKDKTLKADIDRRLDSFLTRALDRSAFGLQGGTAGDIDDDDLDGDDSDEGVEAGSPIKMKRSESSAPSAVAE